MRLPSFRTIRAKLAPLTFFPLFGLDDRLTQVRPTDAPTSSGELNGTLNAIWDKGLTIFFTVVTAIAVIVIIIAGIRLITSGGSPEKVKTAKATIINAALAVILVITAYAVLQIIIGVTGFFASHTAS